MLLKRSRMQALGTNPGTLAFTKNRPLAVSNSHLAVRAIMQRELGAEGLGLFTAAWMISQTVSLFALALLEFGFKPPTLWRREDRSGRMSCCCAL
jgi:hypothetical protein